MFRSSPKLLSPLLRTTYFRLTAALLLVLVVVAFSVSDKTKHRYEKGMRERMAEGKTIPPHWYVPSWMWKGLLVNLGLAGALVALSPWAGRELSKKEEDNVKKRKPMARWEWGVLALIVGMAAVQNAPRLGHSLWGDEEYTMKRLIAPEIERDDRGLLVIQDIPWSTTLWSFRKPTNHIGYTVVARCFHDLFFTAGQGPKDPLFSERLIRFPVYLAGLLSILALVWACRVWGFGGGALFMAFAYSQHAWFMRFGVDARAYGFVLLLVPFLIGLLGRALQTGLWRWWLLFAFAEFFLFWSYFGAVYVLVAFNVAAGLAILFGGKKDQTLMGLRWLVANGVAAMLVIALMAPCLPQLFEFLKQKPLPGTMDMAWFRDAACYLMSGIPWQPWSAESPLCTAWAHSATWPVIFPFAATVMVLGVAVGLVKGVMSLLKDPEKRWLLCVIFGAPVLMLVHQTASGILPYHWYLIPFLPGFILVLAAAIGRLELSSRKAVVVWMMVLISGQVASRERRFLAQYPIEPCRESVALTRQVTNPRHSGYDEGVITSGFSFYTEGYDPGLIEFKDEAGLKELMRRADAEGKELYVNFGFKEWADLHFPQVMKVLGDPRLFKHEATLHGMFLASTREVYHYRKDATKNP